MKPNATCSKCLKSIRKNKTGFCSGCYSHTNHLKELWQKGAYKTFVENHPLRGKVGVNKGKTFTKEWKEKLSISHKKPENIKVAMENLKDFFGKKGEKHGAWKKDRSLINTRIKAGYDYINWRKEVYKRDSYKCKISNSKCCGRIEAHHILSWRDHPELRFNINNGITLCKFHHPLKYSEENRLSPYFKDLIKSQQ